MLQTACLTGGAATGKSEFIRLFAAGRSDVVVFDCDAVVHELLASSDIQKKIGLEFGPTVIHREGGVDRAALRGIVFADSGARRRLEHILHPEVRRRCLAARDRVSSAAGVRLFLAEVPLLYESGFDLARDYEIVVAASPQRQRARLCERRGLSPEMADRILSSQWPILQKVERADIVIWNGGSLACLKRQTVHLSHRLGIPT